jgi:hypothetical protein
MKKRKFISLFILAAFIISCFSTWAFAAPDSQNIIGKEPSVAQKSNTMPTKVDLSAIKYVKAPENFNALTASDADLSKYGFPQKIKPVIKPKVSTINKHNMSVNYDSSWVEPNKTPRYFNDSTCMRVDKNGYLELSCSTMGDSPFDEIISNLIYTPSGAQPFGTDPKVTLMKIQNQDARLIMPSQDQPSEFNNRAELVVKYPPGGEINFHGQIYNYAVLISDKNHIQKIAKTLKFLKK